MVDPELGRGEALRASMLCVPWSVLSRSGARSKSLVPFVSEAWQTCNSVLGGLIELFTSLVALGDTQGSIEAFPVTRADFRVLL